MKHWGKMVLCKNGQYKSLTCCAGEGVLLPREHCIYYSTTTESARVQPAMPSWVRMRSHFA